jgi:hypothetical protein
MSLNLFAMKTTSLLQLFLVPKSSEVIKECSLNDFKPAIQVNNDRKKMQVSLHNAGIGFRQTTHFTFPSDAEMYVGFFCSESALRYKEAQEIGQKKRLLESGLATTRFIKQYNMDMSYETFQQPYQKGPQVETV